MCVCSQYESVKVNVTILLMVGGAFTAAM